MWRSREGGLSFVSAIFLQYGWEIIMRSHYFIFRNVVRGRRYGNMLLHPLSFFCGEIFSFSRHLGWPLLEALLLSHDEPEIPHVVGRPVLLTNIFSPREWFDYRSHYCLRLKFWFAQALLLRGTENPYVLYYVTITCNLETLGL